ncbi:hypothetical protein, partial [Nocardia sp. NPDC004722]
MRNKSRLRAAAAILLLAVAGCGSTPAATPAGTAPAKGSATGGSQPDSTPTGRLVADSGFRPAVDGLGFQNYGNDSGPT